MALDAGRSEREAWYLAQLKPGGLDRAVLNLERQGFTTFMPHRDVTSRRGPRLTTRRRPLFPGYLFVRVDPESSPWRVINNTYGVARLVSLAGAAPSKVPSGLVEDLVARTGADASFVATEQEFRAGERVRLIAGPFAEQVAQIEKIPEANRIHVLLEIMSRSVRTEVTPRHLQRL